MEIFKDQSKTQLETVEDSNEESEAVAPKLDSNIQEEKKDFEKKGGKIAKTGEELFRAVLGRIRRVSWEKTRDRIRREEFEKNFQFNKDRRVRNSIYNGVDDQGSEEEEKADTEEE